MNLVLLRFTNYGPGSAYYVSRGATAVEKRAAALGETNKEEIGQEERKRKRRRREAKVRAQLELKCHNTNVSK